MDSNKKSKLILVLVLATFILPVVVAKLVLNFELYHGGITNKGELIQHQLSYQSLEQTNPFPKQWQIIYLVPEVCDKACQYRLYLLRQTHTALGKERDRVMPLLATTAKSDKRVLSDLSLASFNINEKMQMAIDHHIVIIDPLGKLVMRYQDLTEQQQQILQGKDLLTDLRKMLKLSRIG